jgi:hypothetical protein
MVFYKHGILRQCQHFVIREAVPFPLIRRDANVPGQGFLLVSAIDHFNFFVTQRFFNDGLITLLQSRLKDVELIRVYSSLDDVLA